MERVVWRGRGEGGAEEVVERGGGIEGRVGAEGVVGRERERGI